MEVTTDSRDQKAAAESSDLLGLYASSLYRKCSNCGQTGHNSRTCLEARMDIGGGASGAATRDDSQQGHCKTEVSDVTEPVISSRKEVEDYSDASGSRRKPKEGVRRKGVAWTEEEHKNFLTGLQKLGKGNWRGISRHFVHTKSPTQVASHAQKYFIRQTIAGKRKRRSSLFDLVPEEDKTRETSTVTASTAQPVTEASITEREKEPTRPAEQAATPTLPMQGPDAMAWAYWYQSLMMQQNSMAWMNPMMTPMQTGKPSDGPDPQIIPQMPFAMTGGPVTFGACPPQAPNSIGSARNAPDTTAGNPNASNSSGANPAMAAFLAHQSQMAAFMAMNYMPQLQPDFMARYAAGMQFQAAQAMQVAQAAQSAANMQAQQDLSTPELSAEEEPDQSVEDTDGPSRMSKRTRISVNDSRLDFSNGSDQTEEFGNGALVRPKAQKATSYAELPDCLLDKRESPSNVDSRSKQSNSTRAAVQNVRSWLAQAPKNPPDPRSSKHGSAAGSAAATTFGNPVETSFSDATIREPDKATSRLQEPN